MQSDSESVSADELSGEDEEIDEDAAFTREDWKTYGDWFEGEANAKDDELGTGSDDNPSLDHSQDDGDESASPAFQLHQGFPV